MYFSTAGYSIDMYNRSVVIATHNQYNIHIEIYSQGNQR